MRSSVATLDIAGWRLQSFGDGNARKVVDPIIEPHWEGDRVLVRVSLGGSPEVDLTDEHGMPVDDEAGLGPEIVKATRASSLVLDGYLTFQATRPSEGLAVDGPHAPSTGEMTTQLFLGAGAQRRRQELADSREHALAAGPLAFVAVDLLAVDDDPILDAPLLERKRILEGACRLGNRRLRFAFHHRSIVCRYLLQQLLQEWHVTDPVKRAANRRTL